MKKKFKIIKEKIIWGFFSIPKHAADWANQNEWRIMVIIASILLYMMFGLLFGYLPSWSAVK